LELNDNFNRLIKELGHAINESISESDRVAEVLGRIRAAGYDLFLVLEVTIGFNKRGEKDIVHRERLTGEQSAEDEPTGAREFRLTNHDTEFLRALKISVESRESTD